MFLVGITAREQHTCLKPATNSKSDKIDGVSAMPKYNAVMRLIAIAAKLPCTDVVRKPVPR